MGHYKSLIKAITDAIETGIGGNVSLKEKTLISHLLERGRGKSFFRLEKDDGKPSEGHGMFVITKWLVRLISMPLTLLLFFLNFVCYLFRKESYRNLHVKNLLNIRCSPVISLFVIVIILVAGIVVLVNVITVGVRDIMFAPVNMRTNNQGVITLEQPCLESHSFFLLNASTFWWPTDISVSKDDFVTVTVSGSMYSDIGEVCSAADSNRCLRYNRMFFGPKQKGDLSLDIDSIGTTVCVKPDACFGRLLCEISNEHQDPTKTHEPQIEIIKYKRKDNGFKVNMPGVLYFTFNDVFLSKEIVDTLRKPVDKKTVVMKEELEETHYFNTFDTQLSRGRLEKGLSEIWFNDNVGEYLVNIHIKKYIPNSNIAWYKKPIFIIYRGIGCARKYWIWIVCFTLLYILLDISVSIILQRLNRDLSSEKQG